MPMAPSMPPQEYIESQKCTRCDQVFDDLPSLHDHIINYHAWSPKKQKLALERVEPIVEPVDDEDYAEPDVELEGDEQYAEPDDEPDSEPLQLESDSEPQQLEYPVAHLDFHRSSIETYSLSPSLIENRGLKKFHELQE